MVGNDPGLDLDPAQVLSMRVYHLSDDPVDKYPGGSLDDMLEWIEQQVDARRSPPASAGMLARLLRLFVSSRTMSGNEDQQRVNGRRWKSRVIYAM